MVWATCAFSQDHQSPNKGQFYISPGAVMYSGPSDSEIGYEDQDMGPGIILGYGLSDHWSVEVLGSRVEADFDNVSGRGEDDVELLWLDFVYKLPTSDNWQPFLLMGAGRSEYQFDSLRSDISDTQLNLGVGVLRQLSRNIALRADFRGVTSDSGGGVEPFAFVGITGYLGAGFEPRAAADADGDGVSNSADQCPTTPAGRVVNAEGCQLDGDGDGVVDGDDRCPNSAPGAIVDRTGCAPDADGDGVPDERDACPDTEAGARVDAKGCYIVLEEEVTIDMNIEFATDKAAITQGHLSELNRAITFLKQYPNTRAVIEGHTDADGAAAYNQGLSERRAKAVYEYLVQEADISADRLSWVGFGESRPIADNVSVAGKQKNRRVTALVSGTHQVRQ